MKLISEGEAMPLFYGLVVHRWEYFDKREVAPIPYCWLKRFWYWTLQKTELFDWEREMIRAQRNRFKSEYPKDDGYWSRATERRDGHSYCIACNEESSWCDCDGYWVFKKH